MIRFLSACLSVAILASVALPPAPVAAMPYAGAIVVNNGNRPRPPAVAPQLSTRAVARGFVAESVEACIARKTDIPLGPISCGKAIDLAQAEHEKIAPIYPTFADCENEHPFATPCERRIGKNSHYEVVVHQPAFSGALIFYTPDGKLGVNAVLKGQQGNHWVRPGAPGVAIMPDGVDAALYPWLVIDHRRWGHPFKVSVATRQEAGKNAYHARRKGCSGYGHAIANNGACPRRYQLMEAADLIE